MEKGSQITSPNMENVHPEKPGLSLIPGESRSLVLRITGDWTLGQVHGPGPEELRPAGS